MLRTILLLVIAALCALHATAATPADFAGTWVLRANDGGTMRPSPDGQAIVADRTELSATPEGKRYEICRLID